MKKYGNQFHGLESYYAVSNYGRIKSLARTITKQYKYKKACYIRAERFIKPQQDKCRISPRKNRQS